MKNALFYLTIALLSACTSNRITPEFAVPSATEADDRKHVADEVTFDCLGNFETIRNDEYYRLSMPCMCEIVDSVRVGSEKHIAYVIHWIENVRLHETSRGNFVCRSNADPSGAERSLRGAVIFEALLLRVANTKQGFQCPDDPDATGLYFPTIQLVRHLFPMVYSVDGIMTKDFIDQETPSLMSMLDAGVDYQCQGTIAKPVFEKLQQKYMEGKVVLKEFD